MIAAVVSADEPGRTRVANFLSAGQVEDLATDGYVVLADVLTESECDRFSDLLDAKWREYVASGTPFPAGDEPGVQLVRNPLHGSPDFERFFTDPRVLGAARTMLGPSIILHIINGRRANPGNGMQPLHDLSRPRGGSTQLCNTIWCLDAFTERNGATRVIPGTHRNADNALAKMADDPLESHPDERIVTAARGSVIVFDACLLHGGTANNTDRPRRSVQCNFAVSTLAPFWAWEELPDSTIRELSDEALALLRLDRGFASA